MFRRSELLVSVVLYRRQHLSESPPDSQVNHLLPGFVGRHVEHPRREGVRVCLVRSLLVNGHLGLHQSEGRCVS